MDFFAHQDDARKKTSLLVFYFVLAVALIVLAVYAAAAAIFVVTQAKTGKPAGQVTWWFPQVFEVTAAVTLIVIVLGSLFKIAELRSGGEAVARMLGARPVDPNTTDLDERVLLNVVEEMAIAAGTPVPPVFVLDDEHGINAFAAGYSPSDAVVCATRGTLETLTRDELQGVIGHEFSHILNGDMRLNIRLMGVLNGILLIALIGWWVLRSMRGSDSKKGGGIALFGVALLVIGWVGVFFGKLIKSAASRQREFLADASSVQFTRNPDGIAGALKKIGGLGSKIEHHHAESASHMFFGNAVAASFLHLMDTHPPLDVRIQRIDPTFDGTFPEVERVQRTAQDLHRESLQQQTEKHAAAIRGRSEGRTMAEARETAFGFQSAEAIARVGAPTTEHVAYAAAIVSATPPKLVDAVRQPLGAVATIYCLLLNDDQESRGIQMQCLAQRADRGAAQEAQRILPVVQQVPPEARLPLVGMTIPALVNLSPGQYRQFRGTVEELVDADKQISIFEYALQRMLLNHLSARFDGPKSRAIQYYSRAPLLPTCAGLLSTLAYVGQRDPAAAAQAFAAGVAKLETPNAKPELLAKEQAGLKVLDDALTRLAAASPQIKKRVLQACAACVSADGRVTVEESELLRVIADSLDCPMPPLLAGEVEIS